MASDIVSSMKVCDITQCSICLETFKEPKALPCIHTFCLECLDKHCEERLSANTTVIEEVACPLCRKVFTIPPGGNQDLPNNFFILQLLQVKQSTGVAAENDVAVERLTLCELCSDSDSEILSTSYCIDCEQHLCDRCAAGHKKLKIFKSHQMVRAAEISSFGGKLRRSVSYCDEHPTEQNRSYCYDCKAVACHVCLAEKHKKHDWTELDKSAEKFRERMKDDVENVAACALSKQQRIKQIEIDRNLFVKSVTATQCEISDKCDQLISLIQSHKKQLLEELESFRDKILKEVETEKDEVEREFVVRESFKRYCQEMMDKGTVFEISRTAHGLHARAEELVKTHDEPDCQVCHTLSGVEITFEPTLSASDNIKILIGKLVLKGSTMDRVRQFDFTKFLACPMGVRVMPNNGDHTSGIYMTGLTVLGSELFILRNTSQVEVYKSDDFTVIRNLTVSGSHQLQGLISCSLNNSLYACDPDQQVIYKYDLSNNVTTNWSVGGTCFRLSLTKCYNLLVALYDTRRIQEYTTHGSLIREISLDSSIDKPWHCVQLSTGNFVVSHAGDTQHRVCVVDQSGGIIQSYGGSPGSGVGKLCSPLHLTVDAHDNILVSHHGNRRVQLFSSTLTYLGDIVIPGKQVKSTPFPLHFDERNHTLYIGRYSCGRIFVIDIK